MSSWRVSAVITVLPCSAARTLASSTGHGARLGTAAIAPAASAAPTRLRSAAESTMQHQPRSVSGTTSSTPSRRRPCRSRPRSRSSSASPGGSVSASLSTPALSTAAARRAWKPSAVNATASDVPTRS